MFPLGLLDSGVELVLVRHRRNLFSGYTQQLSVTRFRSYIYLHIAAWRRSPAHASAFLIDMNALEVSAVIPSLEHALARQVRQVYLTFNPIFVPNPYPVPIPGFHRNGINKYHLQLLSHLHRTLQTRRPLLRQWTLPSLDPNAAVRRPVVATDSQRSIFRRLEGRRYQLPY